MDRYAEARYWHTRAWGQEDPAHTARLDQQAARRLLHTARDQEDPALRLKILEHAASRFGHTEAGRTARAELEKIQTLEASLEGPDLMQITKAELRSWPDLWLGRGMRLPPRWFDGSRANGEMRRDGVHFLAPEGKTIVFTILEPDGTQLYVIKPNEKALAKLEPILEEWRREHRARERAHDLFERPTFPVELEADAGPGGVDVYPRLLPLPFDREKLPLYK